MLLLLWSVSAWALNKGIVHRKATSNLLHGTNGVVNQHAYVNIYKTSTDVANALCEDFLSAASLSINKKGSFYCAIPGGSVLKMLSGLAKSEYKSKIDWTKVHLFYVNHKCVKDDDSTSTHKKAKDFFLDAVGIPPSQV